MNEEASEQRHEFYNFKWFRNEIAGAPADCFDRGLDLQSSVRVSQERQIGYADVIYPVPADKIDDPARDELEASADPARKAGMQVEFGGGLVADEAAAKAFRLASTAALAVHTALYESVPPRLYGGTERIVSYLTEELVAQGHEVTLFASGDSVTHARLVRCADVALRLSPTVRDHLPHQVVMLEEIRRRAHEFDVLHFHIDLLHFPLIRDFADRTVTTLHGRLDLPDLKPFYTAFPGIPLVSISNDQRRPIGNANFVATVHHGIPANLYKPVYNPRGGGPLPASS